MKSSISFLVLLIAIAIWSIAPGLVQAQMPGGAPPGHPMPGMMEPGTQLKASYPDSVAFNAAFKELYPLVKPVPTVRERAEKIFMQSSRMFKARGIDSAKAYDSVMKSIDPNMDEKILHNAFRAEFTAEELKQIVGFYKTPVGKHYLEVEQRIVSARSFEIDQMVGHTVSRIIGSMGKPMGMPPGMQHPGMMRTPGAPPGAPPPGGPQVPAPGDQGSQKQ